MTLRRGAAAVLVTASLLALAACATPRSVGGAVTPTAAASSSPSPSASSAPTPAPAPTSPSSSPSATPEPEPTGDAAPPTVDTIDCDAMLDPAVDAGLRQRGLSPAAKPWTQFGFTPSGAAIECPWGLPGDMSARQYYAWAALAHGERDAFARLAVENGFVLEDGAEGTWLSYPASEGPVGGGPMELSGMLLTNDFIAISDTPEQIRDIVWTR